MCSSDLNLSPTHVSVIERGLKVTKLDTFVAIANALDVSADTLLIDVVDNPDKFQLYIDGKEIK